MNITGLRIKTRRKDIGMNADTLALKLSVNRSTIFRYEKGDIEKLPANIIPLIADALHCSPAYLMGWTDDPRPEAAADKTKNATFGSIASNLSTDESEALSLYRRLDPEDRGRVKERMETMLEADKYKKDTSSKKIS